MDKTWLETPCDGGKVAIKTKRSLFNRSRLNAFVTFILRNRRFQARKAEGKVLLNAGCSGNILPSFINLDYLYKPGIDLCWDLIRPLPLPNCSLDGIFTEHCLEHIPFEVVQNQVLPEFKRLLKSGGTLRVSVPDVEKFINAYQRAKRDLDPWPDGAGPSWPAATPMIDINRIMRYQGHQFGWDYETMANALGEVGFIDIVKESFLHGRDPRLLVDSQKRANESLYVEATAP